MESKIKKCTIHKKNSTIQKNNFIRCASVPTSNDINLIESKNKSFFKQSTVPTDSRNLLVSSNAHGALDDSENRQSLPKEWVNQSIVKNSMISKPTIELDYVASRVLTVNVLKKENKKQSLKDILAEKKSGESENNKSNGNTDFKYIRSMIKRKKNNMSSRLYSNIMHGINALNATAGHVDENKRRKLVSRPQGDIMMGKTVTSANTVQAVHSKNNILNTSKISIEDYSNVSQKKVETPKNAQTKNDTNMEETNDKAEKTDMDNVSIATSSAIFKQSTMMKKKNLRPTGGLKLVSNTTSTLNNSSSLLEEKSVTGNKESDVPDNIANKKDIAELNFVANLERVYLNNFEKMCSAEKQQMYLEDENLCAADKECEKSFVSEIVLMSTNPVFLPVSNDLFLAPTSGSVVYITQRSSSKDPELDAEMQIIEQTMKYLSPDVKVFENMDMSETDTQQDASECQNICPGEDIIIREIFNNEAYLQLKNEIQERYDNESEEVTCQVSEKSDYSQSAKKQIQDANANNQKEGEKKSVDDSQRFFEIDDCNVEIFEAGSDISSMSEETFQSTSKKQGVVVKKYEQDVYENHNNAQIRKEGAPRRSGTEEKGTKATKATKAFGKNRGAKKSLPTRFLPVGNSRVVV